MRTVLGNAPAVNTGAALLKCLVANTPFIVVSLVLCEVRCSVFDLAEISIVIMHVGVVWLKVHLCRWGTDSEANFFVDTLDHSHTTLPRGFGTAHGLSMLVAFHPMELWRCPF